MAFGFRPLVSLRGRLYTSTVGAPTLPNISAYPAVLESDDPARGALDPSVWRPISAPGFGEPANITIFEMAVFQDHLYAGVGNPPSLCPFGEWLYVGSGHPPSELDTLEPTPGELIRIAPDDTWEVVAGEPCETPQGVKAPISGLPAGFGHPLAMYVWRMEEHNGWLYAGIHDSTTLLHHPPRHHCGPRLARWVDEHDGVEKIVAAEGGFDLWRTQDGMHWTCITRTGLGNPLNLGVRTLKSTPVGLFVGSYNFFTEAIDPVTGELRGGAEIWVGTP